MRFFLGLLASLPLALAADRSTPPAGALVVGKSGAKYSKIQDAVNALSSTSTSAQAIFIESGTYDEQVYIPALKGAITIYGQTKDTTKYSSNTVTITHGLSQANTSGGNDKTATVRAWASNLKMYNINMVNSYGQGSQALALSASAGNQGYYACQLTGFQDTLLAQTGNQVYAKTLIAGATDFIFGQYATAWFDQVDLRVVSASLGYITANGRDSDTNPSFYVINNSTVAAQSGASVPNGAFYLGRPWRNYARVVFQGTSLSSVINSAGWHIWNTGQENTDHVTFEESGNTGTGASGTRANFSKKIGSPISIATVLGSGWESASYVDKEYIS